MANLRYYLTAWNSTVVDGTSPMVTGLTPTIIDWRLAATGATVSAPSVTEVGGGWYAYQWDNVANGECVGTVDYGAVLTEPTDRFEAIFSTFGEAAQPTDIAAVWDQPLSSHTVSGSSGYALGVLINPLPELYPANNSAMTLTQAVNALISVNNNVKLVGLTLSALKRDGVTTAMTFSVDSATAPTMRIRTG